MFAPKCLPYISRRTVCGSVCSELCSELFAQNRVCSKSCLPNSLPNSLPYSLPNSVHACANNISIANNCLPYYRSRPYNMAYNMLFFGGVQRGRAAYRKHGQSERRAPRCRRLIVLVHGDLVHLQQLSVVHALCICAACRWCRRAGQRASRLLRASSLEAAGCFATRSAPQSSATRTLNSRARLPHSPLACSWQLGASIDGQACAVPLGARRVPC